MNQVVRLQIADRQHELSVKEFRGQRVVTFRDIDELHKRPEGTARKRFNDNRHRFVEGEDFFEVSEPSVIRTLGFERPQGGLPDKVILVTESGYLMLVKSFTDDLAWEVQRQLVNAYFRVKKETQPTPPVSTPVHELHLSVAKSLTEVAGVKPGIALAAAYSQIEKRTGEDLSEYKKLLPPAEHETGFLNATEIGKRSGVSARKVNQALADLGFQYQFEDSKGKKMWRLTDEGKQYGEELPFVRNGHSGYQIRWNEKVIERMEVHQAEEVK